MVREWVVEFSTGVGIIVIGAFILFYIRKVKDKLKRFILRHEQNEEDKKI